MYKLFDFRFDYLITKTILKVLYATLAALLTIGLFVSYILLVRAGNLAGTIGTPIAYFIILLLLRVLCEDRLVKFQMAEDIKEIKNSLLGVCDPKGEEKVKEEDQDSLS